MQRLLTLCTFLLAVPGTFNCNFESNFCGWTQAHNDQFDWTRQSRPSGTANTGPRSDHTTGRELCTCSTVVVVVVVVVGVGVGVVVVVVVVVVVYSHLCLCTGCLVLFYVLVVLCWCAKLLA